MTPLRRLCPRRLSAFTLFLGLVLLVTSSGIRAQDTLCYVLMTVPKLEVPIVRYEMAAAPANYFAGGEDFFTSTRGVRRRIYLGHVDMAVGQPRADLKKYLPPSMAYRGPWEKCDTSIAIAATRSGESREDILTVDAGVLVQGNQATNPEPGKAYFIRYAANSQVPLRPNAWQEVAYWSTDHYCQMLWQYALVKDAPQASASAQSPGEPAPSPLYRLEMIIGTLPGDSLAGLPSCNSAKRAIIAESAAVDSSKWTAFSVHCLPEQPFSSRIALGLTGKRKKDPDYELSCSSTFSGTVGIKLGCVALKSEFRTAAPEKESRLVIPLAADLVPGEWHIQPIPEQPVIYDSGHKPRNKVEMRDGQAHRQPVRANAAFYRVVEVKR